MLFFPAIAAMLSALDANLSKLILRKADPKNFLFSYFIIISFVLTPFAIFFFREKISLSLIGLALLAGFLSFLANNLYYQSLERNEVSSIMPLKSLTILTIMIFGGLFYHSEQFSMMTYLCIIPIIISIALVDAGKSSFKDLFSNRKAIGAFVIWGFFFLLIKEGLKSASPLTLYWMIGLSFLCWQMVFYGRRISFVKLDEKISFHKHKISLFVIFISLIIIILSEYLILYYAIGKLSATVSVLIYNSDILLAAIISNFMHKESFGLKKSVALILSFISIILLQIV